MISQDEILNRLEKEFPQYYISRKRQDYDTKDMWHIDIFFVEKQDFPEISSKICQINEELFPQDDVLIVPILFTPKEAEVHYPEILLKRIMIKRRKDNVSYKQVSIRSDQISSLHNKHAETPHLSIVKKVDEYENQLSSKITYPYVNYTNAA